MHIRIFRTKRIYEAPESGDGVRVLVDRIWPRGMTKEKAQIAVWMKEIAPSAGLRRWFGHEPDRFAEFSRRYEEELLRGDARNDLDQLRIWADESPVTLLYSARDERHNQAVALKLLLERDT